MSSFVFDSSALIAYVWNEPGGLSAAHRVRGSLLGSVNYAETINILVRHGTAPAMAREVLAACRLNIVDFDSDLAEATAELIGQTRKRGLSLADCACLALARRAQLPVLTADRGWRDLDVGVNIQLIR